jgi:hypothetical protein
LEVRGVHSCAGKLLGEFVGSGILADARDHDAVMPQLDRMPSAKNRQTARFGAIWIIAQQRFANPYDGSLSRHETAHCSVSVADRHRQMWSGLAASCCSA